MDTTTPTNHYKNHRFPVELSSHAVWLYFRFCLSFRDGEELVFEECIKKSGSRGQRSSFLYLKIWVPAAEGGG